MKLTASSVIMFVTFSKGLIFNNLPKNRKWYTQASLEVLWGYWKEGNLEL